MPPNRYIAPGGLTTGQAFACIDRYLDRASYGPTWLRRADIAQPVVDALVFGEVELRYYLLHAWVVMANHVHVLCTPLVAASELQKSIKGLLPGKRMNYSDALVSRFGRGNPTITGYATKMSSSGLSRISSAIR